MTDGADRTRVLRFLEADSRIPGPGGERAVTLFRRGTLDLKLSARPLRPNHPARHEQDELYVVVRGRGNLLHDGKRESFAAGDCLFVAAGVEHWFDDFSDDLAVWVLFYGRRGGECPP